MEVSLIMKLIDTSTHSGILIFFKFHQRLRFQSLTYFAQEAPSSGQSFSLKLPFLIQILI